MGDAPLHRTRVYADTSVFGGVLDEEFAEASKRFFERVRRGEYMVLVSDVTIYELEGAPQGVQSVLRGVPDGSIVEVANDEEAKALAKAYVSAGALGKGSSEDAAHVAIATVAGADLLLSWNFRHIVNYDRIRTFNAVNLMRGYRPLDILSPLEVAYGGED